MLYYCTNQEKVNVLKVCTFLVLHLLNMKNRFINFLGWYGLVTVVGAYILVSFSLMAPTNLIYQLLNFTGSIGITIETYYKKDYQPFWLNLIWALIALIAMVSVFVR